MYGAVLVFALLDVAVILGAAVTGSLLEGPESISLHVGAGIVAGMLPIFTHVLFLFYMIGSGSAVKQAVAGFPELARQWVPWTARVKRLSFPSASAGILFSMLGPLAGAEVHSRILLAGPPDRAPALREVTLWWWHLAVVVVAFLVNVRAWVRELDTVRENRRGIAEINASLARARSAAPTSDLSPPPPGLLR